MLAQREDEHEKKTGRRKEREEERQLHSAARKYVRAEETTREGDGVGVRGTEKDVLQGVSAADAETARRV